ncbi:CDP-glycerol glycerophosphotransferase family protein [Rossellomorea sp. NRS-1567]|uniref:CDP-glycerol glycerophosphotransferase family protein n=1 Tax=Rossellomorea sp. NRS-1567 TaxID=3233901 RepID=UPI003D2C1EFF
MKKVLFITYGGGHVNIALPIIKALNNEDEISPIPIALTTATVKFNKEKIPYYNFFDFLKGDDFDRVKTLGRELANKHHNELSGVSLQDSIAYLGPSMHDLETKYGYEKAMEMFQTIGRKAFFPTSVFSKVFDVVKPDLVVTSSSQRAEGAANEVALERGIPTLRFVDLFGHIGNVPNSDYIAVMSEFVKKNLLERDIPSDKIHIVGQPAFDSLFGSSTISKNDILSKENLLNKEKIFLWASQRESEINVLSEEIIGTFANKKELGLIIKLHPSEDGLVQEEVLKRVGNPSNIIIIKDKYDTQDLLRLADVIITKYSTCGLEGILLDKPLITVNLSGEPDKLPFASSGAALGIYHRGDLTKAVTKVLTSPTTNAKMKESRKKFLINKDSTSSSVRLIKKIVANHH